MSELLSFICSFLSDHEPPNDAVVVDSVTVFFESAASPSDAHLKFEARLPLYGGGREPEFIDGLGDEAYSFDGLVVVRNGAELIVVQVSSDDPALRRLVRPLAEYIDARFWP